MDCPRCQSSVPEVAHFCHRCGNDLVPTESKARRGYALAPNEPVVSFALVSSIMPREAGRHPQTYRTALTITVVAALVAAIFGAMPIALLIAAFAIPIVYITYLYDVNLWEDEPIAVTALAFVLTAVLAAIFTVLWTGWMPLQPVLPGADTGILQTPGWLGFVIFAVLVPVVGEIIRQIGPVVLASRPQFDDLMDGVTFGVISGVAYACADTLVRHWDLLTGGLVAPQPAQLGSLIFLAGFVKPLVMGSATGLAVAEFSGLGKGYDGFSGRYVGGVVMAVAANILFNGGVYLLGFVAPSSLSLVLQVVWGLVVLGVLILRLRTVLQAGLLEAALEAASRSDEGGGTTELGFCPRCEMPLLPSAAFCSACGQSTRALVKVPAGSAPPGPAPAQDHAAETEGGVK